MKTRRETLLLMAALPAVLIVGCRDETDAGADRCRLLTLTDEHDCTLCGMTIVRFEGPKGQACLRDGVTVPFCSTSDLVSWAWQPESGPLIDTLYMHDLSHAVWETPSDEHWVAADDAWFVAGHDRRGAMGHAPAPFSRRIDAESFAESRGGRVYTWNDLDWDIIRGNGG